MAYTPFRLLKSCIIYIQVIQWLQHMNNVNLMYLEYRLSGNFPM